LNGLNGRESSLHQQLDFALIGESWNQATKADRIGSRNQQAAGRDESALELHVTP